MNFEKGIKEAKNAATLLRLLIMLDADCTAAFVLAPLIRP